MEVRGELVLARLGSVSAPVIMLGAYAGRSLCACLVLPRNEFYVLVFVGGGECG